MSGKRKRRLWRWLGGLALAGLLICGAVLGFQLIQEGQVKRDPAELEGDYDALIVLGAQVLPTGEPNTQLAWRLDAAGEAWRIHPVPIVVCGAQGADEPLPEAEAMKKYLMGKGVPEVMIYTDPDSFNTNQNLQNAGVILSALPGIRKVAVVTSDYHVPRAMALARDMGFEATGLGSPCKPEYWFKNHARETLAWIKYWLNRLGVPVDWSGKFPS